jgi:purine-binding chemotaxis protein CheW
MPNDLAADASGVRDAPGSRQLLTFTIQDEEYGIDILFVQEIKGFTRITPVPTLPTS